jgi:hypothetical protein
MQNENTPTLAEMKTFLEAECKAILRTLLDKNEAYGNSAADPIRIFSKTDTIEQINVRMDDKLSRMVRGKAAGEDAEFDLLGYLILKRAITAYRKAKAAAVKPQE